MARRPPPPSRDLVIEWGGRSYSGRYSVESGVVTVSSVDGTKSTQVGSSGAERIARMLLAELAASADGRNP